MKKWKILISVIILALVVSACGNSSKETKSEPSDSKKLNGSTILQNRLSNGHGCNA